ncbi:MAG TPA: hypothetical protein VF616_31710 [Duganella sp.]|uniref:hypothetical protein n=1 Tax=Duganella sp. TaxID=1904440 RepID=UPI002ED0207C
MASRSPSPRILAIAGAAAVALAIGVGVYVNNSKPVAPPPAPVKPAEPVVASKAPPAKTPARVVEPHPAASGEAASRTEPKATRTKEQASAALMALPELQQWSSMLEKSSGGKVHGALIEYDPTPRKLNGKSYWQFSFVENSAESAQRWESFLVSSSDDEILVEDATNDEVISLARWRREKHPEKRLSIDG